MMTEDRNAKTDAADGQKKATIRKPAITLLVADAMTETCARPPWCADEMTASHLLKRSTETLLLAAAM
jgi:hypothetical protein